MLLLSYMILGIDSYSYSTSYMCVCKLVELPIPRLAFFFFFMLSFASHDPLCIDEGLGLR